jgi:hypothetical protein
MRHGAVFLFILALACGFAPFAVAAEEKPKDVSKKLLFFESHREKGMEGVLEVVEQH